MACGLVFGAEMSELALWLKMEKQLQQKKLSYNSRHQQQRASETIETIRLNGMTEKARGLRETKNATTSRM